MGCLLSRTLYYNKVYSCFERNGIYWKKIPNTQTYKLTTHITPLSPWRGAGGEAFFSFILATSPLQPYSLATLIGVQRTVVDAGE